MPEPTDPSHANNGPPIPRAMGFGALLDTTFSLYRGHFCSFLRIAAVYFVAMLIGVSISFFDDWIGKGTKTAIWVFYDWCYLLCFRLRGKCACIRECASLSGRED